MSFQGLQAKYRRLYHEKAAWRLLRAENAPHILAFLSTLFAEESDIPYGRARIILETEIERSRELGIWSTATSAGSYLNQWIRSGWLREMDDHLTKTDASETALRFCRQLDDRASGMTASHLRIVQEAVRDFAAAISANSDDRLSLLENKKADIQQEIDAIHSGDMPVLSEMEQKERIKEIYQLASVLTGDFRHVEDEIRQMAKALRVEMIQGDATRGNILTSLMEKEALLAETDAGSAFENFFQLLCDQNRSLELREQLRNILQNQAAQYLTTSQHQFLSQLMRELNRESERVFKVRRRTEEGLRAYIESGAATENRTVNLLLAKLEKLAVSLRDAGCALNTPTALHLPIGAITVSSPESLRLKSPDDKLDTRGVQTHINSREPSDSVLACLEVVQVRQLAQNIRSALIEYGAMTIATLIEKIPLSLGIEELVAHIRIAKAIGALDLDKKEEVLVADKQGITLKASIPTFLLSAELFPDDISELTI